MGDTVRCGTKLNVTHLEEIVPKIHPFLESTQTPHNAKESNELKAQIRVKYFTTVVHTLILYTVYIFLHLPIGARCSIKRVPYIRCRRAGRYRIAESVQVQAAPYPVQPE